MPQNARPEPTKSVGWVAAMLALVVAYFGWAFLAADYFQNDPNSEGRPISGQLDCPAVQPVERLESRLRPSPPG